MSQYQAYQFNSTSYMDFPDWVKDAIATKYIRITLDGADVHVETPNGSVMMEPGEFVVRLTPEDFYVVPPDLFAALARVPKGMHPFVDANGPEPDYQPAQPKNQPKNPIDFSFPAPPYSSAVLARSARAREKQAEFDALPAHRQEQLRKEQTESHTTLAQEGADAPTESDQPNPG